MVSEGKVKKKKKCGVVLGNETNLLQCRGFRCTYTAQRERENASNMCMCVWLCEALVAAGGEQLYSPPDSYEKLGYWGREGGRKEN